MDNLFVMMIIETQGQLKHGWPLKLAGDDAKGCKRQMHWMNTGGNDYEMIPCTLSVLPGIAEYVKDGMSYPVLIERGPYTKKAFEDFLRQHWPKH